MESCWWEGGLNFSKLLRHNFCFFPLFKVERLEALLTSIEDDVCTPHDKWFNKGWTIINYLYVNYLFAYRLTLKFWWTKLWVQLLILPIAFIAINLGWIKYFNWKLI